MMPVSDRNRSVKLAFGALDDRPGLILHWMAISAMKASVRMIPGEDARDEEHGDATSG